MVVMLGAAMAGCVETARGLDVPAGLLDVPELAPRRGDLPDLPPCHLEPGDIAWPSVPGAQPGALPTTALIKTDAYGVSHIYADDAYSLFYANGFVQARDRLFQMDILRQVGYGESARYLGPGQLALDFEVHQKMYTREEIEAQWQAAPVEAKQIVQAYSDGVNAFMAQAVARDQWPAEFAALGRVPPAWQPQDTVAIIDYLIGYFGVDGGYELENLRTLTQLDETLGEKAWGAFGDIVRLSAEDTYTSIHPDDLVLDACETPVDRADATAQLALMGAAAGAVDFGIPTTGDEASFFAETDHGLLDGFKWGSNALVVDGAITDTGQPIMWGAPQMGYYKPPVPYQIGLHGAGFDVAGIGVAGAPGIVIGRNAQLAWTATSGIEDQVDLVSLPLAGPRTYTWDGQEKTMDCWTVEHQVMPSPGGHMGAPLSYEQEVCRAEGWPVVAINEAEEVAWMAKTTTRGEELMGALKWLMAARATSIDEFSELMADYPFTFNYFVTSEDQVAQIHTGDVPLRAPGYDPRLPTPPGAQHDWQGEAYTAQMGTSIRDPSRGYIANWNNAPVAGWRAGDQPGLWGPVQRVQQIEYWIQDRLRDNGGTLSMDDVQWINWQAATHDSHALPFMPYLIDAASADPELADVRGALIDWYGAAVPWRDADADGRYDDPGHAIWDEMIQAMFDGIMGDEMGPLTKQVVLDPPQGANNGDHGTLNNQMGPLLRALRGDSDHDWCDDITTSGRETCQEVLVAGLREAKEHLSGVYGPDVSDWSAPVHQDVFLAFGAFAADERPMINRGSWVQVVSMAEPERSLSVLPPGNSGLITSGELAIATAGIGPEPHRLTAELDLYWTNQYKPFPLTEAEVAAVTVDEQRIFVIPPGT